MAFIEKAGIKRGTLEAECGLPNATLANKSKLNADLTSDIIGKISNKYGELLREKGFHVVNIDPFGNEQFAVLNEVEFEKYNGSRSLPHQSNEKARPEGQAKGIEERIKEIDERTERLAASLSKVLKGQEGIPALIGEILRRDIFQEAGGNPDIADEILKEILQRIGPKLSSDVKAGIGADGHNGGMENP